MTIVANIALLISVISVVYVATQLYLRNPKTDELWNKILKDIEFESKSNPAIRHRLDKFYEDQASINSKFQMKLRLGLVAGILCSIFIVLFQA